LLVGSIDVLFGFFIVGQLFLWLLLLLLLFGFSYFVDCIMKKKGGWGCFATGFATQFFQFLSCIKQL